MTTATHPTTTQLADVLDKAATVIETNGWHRGYLYDDEQADEGTPLNSCRVCAIGAINTAVHGTPRFPTARGKSDTHEIAAAVERWLSLDAGRELAEWNDDLTRTQDDVVRAFRDTAAELRAGEAA